MKERLLIYDHWKKVIFESHTTCMKSIEQK